MLYIVPLVFDVVPQAVDEFSVFSLVLIPLCFGYAIIRYRLMDVDIIFKRGLAYTRRRRRGGGVFRTGGADRGAFHTRMASGTVGGVIAIVVAAFLFQPFRDWIQARLDRFFYRDRLDYRRTLIEFGRTLTSEVRLDPMLALGDGPHFADAAGGPPGDFHRGLGASRTLSHGALDGRASIGRRWI